MEFRWVNNLLEWRQRANLSVADAAKALQVSEYIYRRAEGREAELPATALLLLPTAFKGLTRREAHALEEVA